jgi:demethylmenaquinone methyltransferase / 2-methoxy-6-polyprenyl-1,4-benzoquinol methylase
MNQSPLPAESRYWARPEDRQSAVNSLFDRSASHYDRACNLMAFGGGQRYRREALERAGLRSGMRVLDVGTGTGLLAREMLPILGTAGRIVGLDPSWQMMAEARRHAGLQLVQGVGERLPFTDGQFDFVTMGYALRHVPDLDQTFSEYRRVLKASGRVLLLEITKPASPFGLALAQVYFGAVVPALTWVATGSTSAAELMRFYWDTIANCVSPTIVLEAMRRAGFEAPDRVVMHGIFSEYGATRPGKTTPA